MSIQDLIQLINTQLPDNNQQLITEAILRGVLGDMVNTLSSPLRVFNIESTDVTYNGGGTYTLPVQNELPGAIAIDELLNIYQYDGAVWTLKVDATMFATSVQGAKADSAIQPGDNMSELNDDTDFIDDVIAGDNITIDKTDPKRPQVGLDQATQNNNAYVSQVKQFLEIDANQIFSKRGANEIEFPDKDIILSADSTQPNKIMGNSLLRNIIGGYDNIINDNIASSIFGSHHSEISGGGHNLIAGGSTNTIAGGSYSAIIGGRNVNVDTTNIAFVAGTEDADINGGGVIGAICASGLVIDPAYTGLYAFIGPSSGSKIESTAGNHNSIVGGLDNVLAGAEGFIGQGRNHRVSGIRSSVINGNNNTASGDYSIVLNGISNTAPSWGEVVCGVYATEYTPNSTTGYADDRIFAIGIGPNASNRRNAYSAYKNGRNQFRYINIEQVTPGAKIDGDIWFDGTDLKIRVGGVDKTFTLT